MKLPVFYLGHVFALAREAWLQPYLIVYSESTDKTNLHKPWFSEIQLSNFMVLVTVSLLLYFTLPSAETSGYKANINLK